MHSKRIEALRDAIKSTDEIATLRNAAGSTDEALRRSLPAIREDIVMRELRLEIEMHGCRLGAVGTSLDMVSRFIRSGTGETRGIFRQRRDSGLRTGAASFKVRELLRTLCMISASLQAAQGFPPSVVASVVIEPHLLAQPAVARSVRTIFVTAFAL